MEHHFELQGSVAVCQEMTPVEAGVRYSLDDLPDFGRNGGKRLRDEVRSAYALRTFSSGEVTVISGVRKGSHEDSFRDS